MPGVPFPRSSRACRALAAVALVVGSLTGIVTVAAAPAAAYPTPNVEIDGHGFGHGRGMGQYGALGYATEPDLQRDYGAILGHFYGNTSMGDIGNPEITVILRKFDRRDTVVVQERGHLVTNAAGGTFSALRARRTGVNTFAVDRGDGCGGPWTEIHSGMSGPVVFAPQHRNEDRAEMVQVCEPAGGVRWLRGEIRAVEGLDNTARTVNALDMQGYLKGTVPRESPASWADRAGGAGIHAVKAQAVAARSYAQSSDLAPYAKTCDSTACQVYGGRAFQDSSGFFDLEDGRSNRAVDETHGQVRVLGGGAVARTEYSSSSGGHTLPGTFPAVPDEGDRISPFHNWHVSIPASDVGNRYGVGTLNAVRITERYGFGDWGGHARTVVIEGSSGTRQVSGSDFQFEFGLRSDWFNTADAARTQPAVVNPGWVAQNGTSASDVAMAQISGGWEMFHIGTGNVIYRRKLQNGVQTGWTPIANAWAKRIAVTTSADGRAELFYIGLNDQIYHNWESTPGGNISNWEGLGGFAREIAAARGGSLWEVFHVGGDHAIYRATQGDHGWRRIPSWAYSVAAATSRDGRVELFHIGSQRNVWHAWQPSPGANFGGWGDVGGWVTAIGATSVGNGEYELYSIGGHDSIWRNAPWSGVPAWQQLTGAGTRIAAAKNPDGRVEVLHLGGGNVVYHAWQKSVGWF